MIQVSEALLLELEGCGAVVRCTCLLHFGIYKAQHDHGLGTTFDLVKRHGGAHVHVLDDASLNAVPFVYDPGECKKQQCVN